MLYMDDGTHRRIFSSIMLTKRICINRALILKSLDVNLILITLIATGVLFSSVSVSTRLYISDDRRYRAHIQWHKHIIHICLDGGEIYKQLKFRIKIVGFSNSMDSTLLGCTFG